MEDVDAEDLMVSASRSEPRSPRKGISGGYKVMRHRCTIVCGTIDIASVQQRCMFIVLAPWSAWAGIARRRSPGHVVYLETQETRICARGGHGGGSEARP